MTGSRFQTRLPIPCLSSNEIYSPGNCGPAAPHPATESEKALGNLLQEKDKTRRKIVCCLETAWIQKGTRGRRSCLHNNHLPTSPAKISHFILGGRRKSEKKNQSLVLRRSEKAETHLHGLRLIHKGQGKCLSPCSPNISNTWVS